MVIGVALILSLDVILVAVLNRDIIYSSCCIMCAICSSNRAVSGSFSAPKCSGNPLLVESYFQGRFAAGLAAIVHRPPATGAVLRERHSALRVPRSVETPAASTKLLSSGLVIALYLAGRAEHSCPALHLLLDVHALSAAPPVLLQSLPPRTMQKVSSVSATPKPTVLSQGAR